MTDWRRDYSVGYEFWTVDPATWRDAEPYGPVVSFSLSESEPGENMGDLMGRGEMATLSPLPAEAYVRCYLVATQDGTAARECLGTMLAQTPTTELDGKAAQVSVGLYPPTLELRESGLAAGFTLATGSDVVSSAAELVRSKCRAPVIAPPSGPALSAPYTAETGDDPLSYVQSLLRAHGHALRVTPRGELSIESDRDPTAMAPVWTYDDGNASIMEAGVQVLEDWYGLPNVVEVVTGMTVGRAENASPSSRLSTATRGRTVLERVTDSGLPDSASQAVADEWAMRRLRERSRVTSAVTYRHVYNGVRVGDGVRMDYTRHALDETGRVTAKTTTGGVGQACMVEETMEFSEDLWQAT